MSWISTTIDSLSAVTIAGQIVLVFIALSYVPGLSFLRRFIERRTLLWMFIVALTATLGSLFLSEIAGFDPCRLCWFQRIAMYPIVILTGIALWRNDRSVAYYVLPLCLIGGFIAAWHYGEHVWTAFHPADPSIPCGVEGVSCAVPPYWHFGYVTIPLMALTAFVLNAVGCVWLLQRRSS